jgi:hypothetical protein
VKSWTCSPIRILRDVLIAGTYNAHPISGGGDRHN